MVGHHPTNKLIGREPIPHQKNLSTNPHAKASEYPVLAPVSGRYPKEGGRLLTCYSPVRHSSTQQKLGFSVRLACVKHAASVRPEPGSNSPNKNKNVKAQKNQPTKQGQPAIPTKNTQKQKTGIKQKQTNTLSSSQTTPTHPRQPNHKAQPPTAVNHHHKPTGPRRQVNNLPTPTPKVKPKQRDPQHTQQNPTNTTKTRPQPRAPAPASG